MINKEIILKTLFQPAPLWAFIEAPLLGRLLPIDQDMEMGEAFLPFPDMSLRLDPLPRDVVVLPEVQPCRLACLRLVGRRERLLLMMAIGRN